MVFARTHQRNSRSRIDRVRQIVSIAGNNSLWPRVMLECQEMIEPQAKKRGISVVFSRFDTPCFVKADRTRVKQVFINLLSNAVKYNRPHGSVAVEYQATTSGRIRVCVKDSGEGLTPTSWRNCSAVQSSRSASERARKHRHRSRYDQTAD